MNIPKILKTIRPGAQWTLNGDNYEGLNWLDTKQTKPDLAEIESAWPSVQEQLAIAANRLSADEIERADCKLDETIMSLIDQTKDEWLTWAIDNFPSLSLAEKNRLGNVFWVVAICVRRCIRSANQRTG